MIRKILIILFIIFLCIIPSKSYAEELIYQGKIEISAYYPFEDAEYPNNFQGIPLNTLVDDIVACPTGSDLLGKTVLIMTEDHQLLKRKVLDTGCLPGRLDMLVKDKKAMNAWGNEGLQDCYVWVVEY